MTKSKTIRLAIDTGAYQLGPVPPDTRVVIEAGYLFAGGARALINEALLKQDDGAASNRAVLERIAERVVVAWSVSETLDRAAVAQFLLALYEEHADAALAFSKALADKTRFALPSLVDAEALGEG
jgi:hypothetical protein